MATFIRSTTLGILVVVAGCSRFTPQTEILDLTDQNKSQASLQVGEERCDLRIPLVTKTQLWTWGTSTENACEYSIQASVDTGTRTYDLGYSNFNGSNVPCRGSLAELIISGQCSVWRVNGASGENIGEMNFELDGNILHLSLQSPQLIKEIFEDRPETASLVTGGVMLLPHNIPLRIEYTQ